MEKLNKKEIKVTQKGKKVVIHIVKNKQKLKNFDLNFLLISTINEYYNYFLFKFDKFSLKNYYFFK